MQFSTLAMAAATVSAVSAWPANGTIAYTTDIVTAYTTYCPASTQVTVGNATYTVTEATTLTITNCPCTIVKPVSSTPAIQCSTCIVATHTPVWSDGTASVSVPVVSPVTNATTVPAASSTQSTTAAASGTPTTLPTNAGDKMVAVSGLALAGLVALVSYVL